ncbi:Uncharacterized protein APZ42_003165, partial [Daphnia magna]
GRLARFDPGLGDSASRQGPPAGHDAGQLHRQGRRVGPPGLIAARAVRWACAPSGLGPRWF